MGDYDSRSIANVILKYSWKNNIEVTKMQLIKLVYLAHGWSLAFLEKPIVNDTPEAWKLGPVYPKLYNKLSGYTSQSVNKLIADEETNIPYTANELSGGEKALIKNVTTSYGKYGAFVLSDMTHKDGTPWSKTYQNGIGLYKPIPENILAEYYKKLKKDRNLDGNNYNY